MVLLFFLLLLLLLLHPSLLLSFQTQLLFLKLECPSLFRLLDQPLSRLPLLLPGVTRRLHAHLHVPKPVIVIARRFDIMTFTAPVRWRVRWWHLVRLGPPVALLSEVRLEQVFLGETRMAHRTLKGGAHSGWTLRGYLLGSRGLVHPIPFLAFGPFPTHLLLLLLLLVLMMMMVSLWCEGWWLLLLLLLLLSFC